MTRATAKRGKASFRFSLDVQPRWKDLDAMGVLNNAVYFTLFEQARWAYFHRLGLARGGQFPFVLAETACRFLSPVLDGERLRVRARTTRLGTKSFHMEYVVESIPRRRRVALGSAALVYTSSDLRPAVMPEAFRRPIERYERLQAP